jgi:hypothetical protein
LARFEEYDTVGLTYFILKFLDPADCDLFVKEVLLRGPGAKRLLENGNQARDFF